MKGMTDLPLHLLPGSPVWVRTHPRRPDRVAGVVMKRRFRRPDGVWMVHVDLLSDWSMNGTYPVGQVDERQEVEL